MFITFLIYDSKGSFTLDRSKTLFSVRFNVCSKKHINFV